MKKILALLLAVLTIFAMVSCADFMGKDDEKPVAPIAFKVGYGTYTHNTENPKAFDFEEVIPEAKGFYTFESVTLSSQLDANKQAKCIAIEATYSGDTSNDASYSWEVYKLGDANARGTNFDTAAKIIAQKNKWYGTRAIFDKTVYSEAGTYLAKFEIEKKNGLVEKHYFELVIEEVE